MDARERKVRELFARAIELHPNEREQLLLSECADEAMRAELSSLLSFHETRDERFDLPAMEDERVAKAAGTSAAAKALRAGDRVGRYSISRVIGIGGMGIVYEAHRDDGAEDIPKKVALKVIRPGLLTATNLKRFAREAQLLSRLAHPAIARVYEAGTYQHGRTEAPFLAMELVEGRPLHEHARRESLAISARLELFIRVCEGVQHAHERAVIHRDIKPANILVHGKGGSAQPKILDFGVARLTGDEGRMTTLRTTLGQLIGTLAYMSPEHVSAEGGEPKAASDVYSLGVVLFELLTGRQPYELDGQSVMECVRTILNKEPARAGSVDSRLKGDIDSIIRKAMSKSPEDRYDSAASLATDIRKHLAGETVSVRELSAFDKLRRIARRSR